MFCMANLEPSKNCIQTLQANTTMNDEDIEVVGGESTQRIERSLQPRNLDCRSEEEQDRALEEALSSSDWIEWKPSNDDDMSSGAEG